MDATVGGVMVVVQVCFFLQYLQGNENPIKKHQRDQVDGATNSHSHEGRSRSEFGEHSFFFLWQVMQQLIQNKKTITTRPSTPRGVSSFSIIISPSQLLFPLCESR